MLFLRSCPGKDGRIKPNDVVLQINGKAVSDMDPNSLKEEISSSSTVRLLLRRANSTFDVHLLQAEETVHSPPSIMSAPADFPNLAGIGVLFRKERDGAIVVTECSPDGPAGAPIFHFHKKRLPSSGRDGRIRPDDRVLKIDNSAVTGLSLGDLQKLILGEVGTLVTIQLVRIMRGTGQEINVEVKLARGIANYQRSGERSARSLSPVSCASTTFSSNNYSGVGILFRKDSQSNFVVSNCPPEGPAGGVSWREAVLRWGSAGRDGRIQPDDVLWKIDGFEVQGFSVSQLRNKIYGPPGSSVVLHLT